jgi:putative transposase
MLISLTTLLATLSSIFRSRAALQLENLALRHEISVLQRSARKRPRLTPVDRLLWAWLVPGVERMALDAGHRSTGDGRCLASCRLSAVPDLESATRPTRTTGHFDRGTRSDRKMCRENPTWGAPRIHGELLKLGIDIGERTGAGEWEGERAQGAGHSRIEPAQ